MKLLLLTLALSACSLNWNAWDVGKRPVAAEGSDPAWTFRVDQVASMWSARLIESGCTTVHPFDGSAGTGPVYLLPEAEYDSFADVSDSDGVTWTYRINILEYPPTAASSVNIGTPGTLAHEMGHALGLEHVSVDEDPLSIMHPTNDNIAEPDARDVEMVMDILGCR